MPGKARCPGIPRAAGMPGEVRRPGMPPAADTSGRSISRMSRVPLDLAILADNGLRRGRTTGTCATAAFKAALMLILRQEAVAEVTVSLPDSRYYLSVPIKEVKRLEDGSARAAVIKDAGDDPDCTDRAVIFVLVRINNRGELRFLAGSGVGTV